MDLKNINPVLVGALLLAPFLYGENNIYGIRSRIGASIQSVSAHSKVKLISQVNPSIKGVTRDGMFKVVSGKLWGDLVCAGWQTAELQTPLYTEEPGCLKYSEGFSLYGNFPNPFNPATTISYLLPGECRVVVKIYKLLGQEVCTLKDEIQSGGEKTLVWNGSSSNGQHVSSGVYICQIQAGTQVRSIKMLMMK